MMISIESFFFMLSSQYEKKQKLRVFGNFKMREKRILYSNFYNLCFALNLISHIYTLIIRILSLQLLIYVYILNYYYLCCFLTFLTLEKKLKIVNLYNNMLLILNYLKKIICSLFRKKISVIFCLLSNIHCSVLV